MRSKLGRPGPSRETLIWRLRLIPIPRAREGTHNDGVACERCLCEFRVLLRLVFFL